MLHPVELAAYRCKFPWISPGSTDYPLRPSSAHSASLPSTRLSAMDSFGETKYYMQLQVKFHRLGRAVEISFYEGTSKDHGTLPNLYHLTTLPEALPVIFAGSCNRTILLHIPLLSSFCLLSVVVFGKHPNCISREETRPSATRSAEFCYWNRSLGFCFFSRLRCLLTTWSLQTILVQKSKSRFYLSYPVTKDFVNTLNFPLYVFLCLMSTYNCSSTHLRSFLLDGGVWTIIWVCSPVSRFLLVDVPSFGWLKKDHTWEFQTTLFGQAVHDEPSQLNFEAIPRTQTPVLWALSGSIGSNRKSRLPARLVASENCAGHSMSSFITFV